MSTQKKSKESTPLRMLITLTEENDYGDQVLRYKAEPVFINDNGSIIRVSSYNSEQGDLEDFSVRASRNAKYPSDQLRARFEFHEVYGVDLERAEQIVKVLRKVARKVDQLSEKFGHPKDAATFTAYVAVAIGAESFVRRVELAKDPAGLGYRLMNARAMEDWLRTEERKWEEKYNVKRKEDE